jgi:hypothetical protein
MAPTTFNPAAHAPLTDLGERLRELAGDAAYRAGRDYLRKGKVQDGAVAMNSAHATVKGSTEYRVTVSFPSVEDTKVSCTCPAHRRSAYCKHVVALCAALLEQPAAFAVLDVLPEPPATKKAPARRGASSKGSKKAEPAALRTAGLEVLDRLLTELTDGGLMQLGPDKVALIEQCAELVRALKLRRLGNLLMALRRAVAGPAGVHGAASVDGAAFARLLLDLYLCRTATGAQLAGTVALDPRLAEDLLGKTWRAGELEPVTGLELVQVAATTESDGEFTIESSHLVDLASGAVYVERQITPIRLRGNPKAQHGVRLLVDEAGLYPGLAPRRIRLARTRRAPLRAEDVGRLVDGAVGDLSDVRRRLIERAAVPFGEAEVAVLFRPSLLFGPAKQDAEDDGQQPKGRRGGRAISERTIGGEDGAGRFLTVSLPSTLADELAVIAQAPGTFALFGTVSLGADGVAMRCLSVVVSAGSPVWQGGRGRIVPEAW